MKQRTSLRPVALSVLLTVLSLTFAAPAVPQALRLPAVIGDHMVLQRGKPVPLWGWADPGSAVTVEAFGQSHDTTVDADGKWSVTLAALAANASPQEITIMTSGGTAGGETRTLTDVLVGEVWLCSGQSNMDMRLRKVDDAEAHITAADHDALRLFRVERAVADEPQDDLDAHWVPSNPEDATDFSAVGYFFGRQLQSELGVPVGIIHSAYGGTPAEAWTPPDAMAGDPDLQPILDRQAQRDAEYQAQLAAYEAAVAAAASTNGQPQDAASYPKEPTPPTERYTPAGLYHAMIHPLRPFALRGFVWYQGESNVWRARQYEPLLDALIVSWRRDWGDDTLPFAVIQLPGYTTPPRVPQGQDSWPELRDSQLLVAKADPYTGLIVTIDVGNSTDVHPTAKEPVAQRVTQWALHAAYGQDVVPSGPILVDHRIEGDRVILTFDHAGGGLTTRDGEPLRGFVIADQSKKFRWAVAEVIDERTLAVSEAKVAEPAAVRYAWDDDPAWGNFTNAAGLPASPFRTDDWEGITDDSR